MNRRLAAFALAWIAASPAACTRDNPTKRTTETVSDTASVSTGAIAAATASSTADGASSASVNENVPEKPPLPPWAAHVRRPQPVVPSALFARGLTGPIADTFEGLLACQITVSGTHWDAIVPFFGSSVDGFPDIRVQHGDAAVFLPENTPSGTAIFAGMTITKDSRLTMNVADSDAVRNDPIAEVSLDASRGFPLEAKTPSMTLVCRGVPRSALSAEIKPREVALERALAAMEKSPATIDLVRPETSRKGIDVAQKAVLELVTYVGFDDANVRSAIKRITAVEASQGSRYAEAIDAELAKHAKTDFQSLPSGRVRCHPTKEGVVEVEVGARALQHEWAAKNLGPLQFRYISKAGVEIAPTFDSLFVDGQKIEDLNATIPAKAKVEYEYDYRSTFSIDEKPYAIVVREGAKRVYLCAYASH